MWNKVLLLITLLLSGYSSSFAQYLGKDQGHILKFIEANKYRIENLKQDESSINFTFEEEDERNRTFFVDYSFSLRNSICIAYTKTALIHEYWATTILDLVNLKQAKPSGNHIDIDGIKLNSKYTFEEETLSITKNNDTFMLKYELIDK